MILTNNNVTKITCDKCKTESTASNDNYNEVFWKEGWALNLGRKYEHLCFNCLPKNKQKLMTKFIKNHENYI